MVERQHEGPRHVGDTVEAVTVAGDIAAFGDADCDVVVDLTNAGVARSVVPALVGQGIDVVVGTSGLGDDDLAAFEVACAGEDAGNVVVAANFAISAVVLLRLAEIAAPFFDAAGHVLGSVSSSGPAFRYSSTADDDHVAHAGQVLAAARAITQSLEARAAR